MNKKDLALQLAEALHLVKAMQASLGEVIDTAPHEDPLTTTYRAVVEITYLRKRVDDLSKSR